MGRGTRTPGERVTFVGLSIDLGGSFLIGSRVHTSEAVLYTCLPVFSVCGNGELVSLTHSGFHYLGKPTTAPAVTPVPLSSISEERLPAEWGPGRVCVSVNVCTLHPKAAHVASLCTDRSEDAVSTPHGFRVLSHRSGARTSVKEGRLPM